MFNRWLLTTVTLFIVMWVWTFLHSLFFFSCSKKYDYVNAQMIGFTDHNYKKDAQFHVEQMTAYNCDFVVADFVVADEMNCECE